MKILQETSRVNTETSRFHSGSTSLALLCHRSDKSFSPETNRPEPEAGPRTIAEKTEHTEEFLTGGNRENGGRRVDDGGKGECDRYMVSVEKTDAAELEDAANLRATARRLGQACAAERVILFGSRATGRASADSDVDLALILPEGSNARATLNVAHRLLWPRKFPIDLVAITTTVWAEKSTLLAREIEVQGIVLYERGTD